MIWTASRKSSSNISYEATEYAFRLEDVIRRTHFCIASEFLKHIRQRHWVHCTASAEDSDSSVWLAFRERGHLRLVQPRSREIQMQHALLSESRGWIHYSHRRTRKYESVNSHSLPWAQRNEAVEPSVCHFLNCLLIAVLFDLRNESFTLAHFFKWQALPATEAFSSP